MSSFSRMLVWLLATVLVLQLTLGGWPRLKLWVHNKFIGVAA